ncbi:MAG: PepSY domain-containing protein [Thiobacillus sp.]|nr:PepSY domain-containing protein [Thiobacillus sp.]
MGWKAIHRWLGLTIGTLAVVLGITGAILAFDPVQQAWQAPAAPDNLSVATLVERVTRTIPGAEEIRHLPSGAIAVFSFDGDQARASYVDPADGRVLGAWQPSALPRWVKNLHRSLLLGDAGRWGAAGIALAVGVLCISALVLLLRRMGGWRRLMARVRGSLAQRIHVVTGRVVLAVLCLTSLTALTMSASTLGLVTLDAGTEPDVVSVASGHPDLPVGQLSMLQNLSVRDLRKLNFPNAADPEDTWKLATRQGEAWIDRYSGKTWRSASTTGRWCCTLEKGPGPGPWCSRSSAPACRCSGCRASSSGGRHAVRRRASRVTAHWHRPTCSSSLPVKVAARGALPRRCTTR